MSVEVSAAQSCLNEVYGILKDNPKAGVFVIAVDPESKGWDYFYHLGDVDSTSMMGYIERAKLLYVADQGEGNES